LTRCENIHGDKYIYPVEKWGKYNSKTKVEIVCPKHGPFFQSLSNHVHSVNPTKCPSCSHNRQPTRSERIKQAVAVHGFKYDYSKWPLNVSASTRVSTSCNLCNHVWEHSVDNHVRGRKCPNCPTHLAKVNADHSTANAMNRKYDMCRNHIAAANDRHSGKYDYSLISDFFNVKDLQSIVCPDHGVFHSVFSNHSMNGSQCPNCMNEIMKNKYCFGFDQWVSILSEIHPDLTFREHGNGSETAKDKIIAKCKHHGEWQTSIDSLRAGASCPSCSGQSQKFLYVNNVGGVCLKYGIAKDVNIRLRNQNKRNRIQMETLIVFEFSEYSSCRACESAIKKTVKSVMSRTDLEDGWTETCSHYDIETIIEKVSEYGGVKI